MLVFCFERRSRTSGSIQALNYCLLSLSNDCWLNPSVDRLMSLFDDCWVGLTHVPIRRAWLYSMGLRSIDSPACTYFLALGICAMGVM
jgi:hypothetical protein